MCKGADSHGTWKLSAFQIQLNTTASIADCVSKGPPAPIQHTEKENGSCPVHAGAGGGKNSEVVCRD